MKKRSKRLTLQSRRIPAFPRRLVVLIAALFTPVGTSLALPTGEQVVAGSAAVLRPSAQSMTIQQSSPRAIINWQSFSIAKPESVSFQQPAPSSVVLNRVVGMSASAIAGRMSANGQVFLVNPNGVLFTSSAVVDVGGLVASTLDISNQDFMAGRYRFSGSGRSVTNAGSLRAADGGTVALLGGQVQNDGTITAKLGTVVLAAGNRVTLDFAGDGLTKVSVSESALAAVIENRGAVMADGGQVILTAQAADALTRAVVNQSGLVRARTLTERAGMIVLDGGDTGETLASGTLDVSGREPGQKGGEIQVLGHHVGVTGAALLDASGDAGGGKILVGGDYQGKNPDVPNSRSTTIGPDVTIAADTLRQGDGGRVIVWSDGPTAMHGAITAKGGTQAGNGGFIETSGSQLKVSGARVSAGAIRGTPGKWLLDPQDIIIGPAEASTISNSLDANSVSIVTTDVPPPPDALPLPGVEGPGNITVDSPIAKVSGQSTTLQLLADANISVNAPISSTAGPLNVEMVSRKGGAATGFVNVFSDISTNGGRVVITGGPEGLNTIGAQNIADIQGFAVGSDGGGVSVSSVTINAGGGDVLIRGAEPFTSGVDIFSSTITGGRVELTGIGGSASGDGVRILGSALTAVQELSIEGTGGNTGAVFDSAVRAGAGIRVESFEDIEGGSSQPALVQGETIRLTGHGGSILSSSPGYGGIGGPGIVIDGSAGDGGPAFVTMTGDQLFASGTAGSGLGGSPGGAGVTITNATIQTANGDLVIGGSGLQNFGIEVASGAEVLNTGSGVIDLRGDTQGGAAGLKIDGQIGAPNSAANVLLVSTGAVTSGGRLIDVSGMAAAGRKIETSGTIAVRFVDSTPIAVDGSVLNFLAPGPGGVVVGSDAQTGSITVVAPIDLPYSLTLQQAASTEAGGISVDAPLSVRDHTLALISGGRISQSAPVTAQNLLLSSGSEDLSFTVTGNNVNTASISALGGNASFGTAGPLTLGPVSASVFSPTRGVSVTTLQDSASKSDFLAQNVEGNLTLKQSISTLGSEIALVAGGAFVYAGGQLLPGGNGRWTVWVNTLPAVGENRGLVPSSPLPNIYGCTYPGVCASGAIVPTTGNHFVYQQQPPLTFTTLQPQLRRTYGDVNPTFPAGSVTGVRTDLGDTQADAVNGQFPELPPPNANVGTYRLVGTFSSPAGYIFRPPPEGANQITTTVTLDIGPATLTYVANPATREYGLDNPTFSGRVTGYRLSDTQENATTGTLTFASQATPASPVGGLPIEGGGLAANNGNYVLVQDPGNSTALTITPAPLTYVADRVVREYGFPNPALTGTVAGFRNADTIASAASGVVTFTTPASVVSNPGTYPVVGSGLTPNGNYQFVPPDQAPSNATALLVTPQQTGYELVSDIPTFDRTPGFSDTNVYASGFLLPSMCIATEPMVSWSGAAATGDILEIEWARVRVRPKLTNCVSIGDRDYCRDF